VVAREDERRSAALQDLTPVQQERLRAAVRLWIQYLLDNAPLNRENEKQTHQERVKATELQVVQLRLEI
jgi:hypothetical protein